MAVDVHIVLVVVTSESWALKDYSLKIEDSRLLVVVLVTLKSVNKDMRLAS